MSTLAARAKAQIPLATAVFSKVKMGHIPNPTGQIFVFLTNRVRICYIHICIILQSMILV